MKRSLLLILVAACGSSSPPPTAPEAPPPFSRVAAPAGPAVPVAKTPPAEDPYLWLEQIEDSKSLDWARAQNAKTKAALEAVPGFKQNQDRVRAIMDAKDKVPYAYKQGKWLYNFWTDDVNPRGLWRRTTLADYAKDKPTWQTVIDVDALNKAENASFVWKGASCLYPKYERCLVNLSRGGGDSTVVRELDLEHQKWLADGFVLPEAKTQIGWKDHDTVFVATDFGPGSMTKSGYARIVKEWKRGTPLSAATTIYEAKDTDIAVGAGRQWDHGHTHDIIQLEVSTFASDMFLWDGKTATKIDKPDDAQVELWDDQILITLRKDWVLGSTTWPAGSLLAANEKDYLAGSRAFTPLFTPTPTTSLNGVTGAKTKVYVQQLEDVRDGLVAWSRTGSGKNRTWKSAKVPPPAGTSFSIGAWDDDENDDYWMFESGFVTPTTVSLVKNGKKQPLKHGKARFDATGLEVTQHFVTSKDGTRVPYFQVAKKDVKLDGSNATVIEGYGGFEISLTPYYNPIVGVAWLEKGGVYVVPNLRGGGEYGPKWHQAATKLNRQRVYEDFAAIAEDLIARKVTTPPKLGIMGGSNGGLLVGVMMTERPELFGAVVCEAPLLDMKRYHKLLAGASWMEEYGNPDVPEEWAAIAKYSPYQNVHEETKYPPVLFTTSTRDDRVHPGHARKMAARMIEQGHDVLFYENIEGGHAGAADAEQAALMTTLAYSFLWKQLGLVPVSG
ncbi:MAG: prolyl oligopeptidase family serine peptidase [Deltaproteobacteria bacterium]